MMKSTSMNLKSTSWSVLINCYENTFFFHFICVVVEMKIFDHFLLILWLQQLYDLELTEFLNFQKNANQENCRQYSCILFFIDNLEYIYIYIYTHTGFQKGFDIERYIDRYILLFSFTCARVHFSFAIVQLVKKLGSTINFFFVGFFVPVWKEHVVWVFLEKSIRPAIQICNGEL